MELVGRPVPIAGPPLHLRTEATATKAVPGTSNTRRSWSSALSLALPAVFASRRGSGWERIGNRKNRKKVKEMEVGMLEPSA
eukprot:Skav233756  [mRNA]  locus=scaffold1792:372382:376763:- [translate_table: standard]